MSKSPEDRFPPDYMDVVERLRSEPLPASELDMDQIKLRTMARARRPQGGRRLVMRSRLTAILVALSLLGTTAAIGVATSSNSNSGGNGNSAASSQYPKPGMGCGDQNHEHTGPPGNPGKTPADCPPNAGPKK
jgi:hypothetical protein